MLSPKSVRPTGPPTGSFHKKCRFSQSRDCAGGISGDHIISASVLREISSDRITLQSPNYSRTISSRGDSLKTKWLCRRHNSALSPIDLQAARLFRAVQTIEHALAGTSTSPLKLFLFEGFDVERWLLKTLLAAYHGRLTNIVPGRYNLPDHAMKLFELPIGGPYGLYVPVREATGDVHATRVSRSAQLRILTEGPLVAGIEVSLGGLELRYLIAGSTTSVAMEAERCAWRPKFINLFQAQNVFTIGLAWMKGSDSTIWLSRGDPAASVPQNEKSE